MVGKREIAKLEREKLEEKIDFITRKDKNSGGKCGSFCLKKSAIGLTMGRINPVSYT